MSKILLLGADPATVCAYRRHFKRLGVTLASSETVEPLNDFIRLAGPAAVLLDVTRVKTDSAQLVREIRSQPEFAALPVFALADKDSVSALSLTRSENSTRVFFKSSIVNPELVQAVTEALNGTQKDTVGARAEDTPENGSADQTHNLAAEAGPKNPAVPAEAKTVIRALLDEFRSFCAMPEGSRGEGLAQMREHLRNLRRLLLGSQQTILTAFASALVRLVMTFSNDGAKIPSSCVRTLSAAIDILAYALSGDVQSDQVGKVPVRVLVLDNGKDSRLALQTALCSPELGLVVCESAEQAIAALKTTNFDVVLADIRMLQASEFPAQFRQLPNAKEIPLILLAPSFDLDTRIQSALNGGCDVVAAPFTFNEVCVKAFSFAIKRRLGQMASNPSLAQPPSSGEENAKPNQAENGTLKCGQIERQDPDTVKLRAGVSESDTEHVEVTTSIREVETQLQGELSAARVPGSPNRSPQERLIELELAFDPAKTECARLVSENASLREAEVAKKNELQKSDETRQQLHESLDEMKAPSDRQTTAQAAAQEELNGAVKSHEELEQKTAEAPRQEEQSRSALRAQPLKAEDSPRKLPDISALDRLVGELNQARSQLLEERLHGQHIEAARIELEDEKQKLTKKLELAAEIESTQQQSIEALELNLRDGKTRFESLEASLRDTSQECRRLESKAKDLEVRLDHMTSQASIQAMVEESLRRREAELNSWILQQEAEVTHARSALEASHAETRRTKERLHATLSRVLQELDQDPVR